MSLAPAQNWQNLAFHITDIVSCLPSHRCQNGDFCYWVRAIISKRFASTCTSNAQEKRQGPALISLTHLLCGSTHVLSIKEPVTRSSCGLCFQSSTVGTIQGSDLSPSGLSRPPYPNLTINYKQHPQDSLRKISPPHSRQYFLEMIPIRFSLSFSSCIFYVM